MKVKCCIVEDEPIARDLLVKYIADMPQLELTFAAANAIEAGEMLRANPIDLMFLDIQMPKLSGLSFLKSLPNPPLVIFTTAFAEHALESYELNAVDYLLKPFSFGRFVQAVNKSLARIHPNQKSNNQPVFLKADKKVYQLNLADITHLEAMGDYVKVHFNGKYIMVHRTLQSLLEELGENHLIQVHRSWAVSLQHLSFLEGNYLKISDFEVPVGKSFKSNLLKRINPTD